MSDPETLAVYAARAQDYATDYAPDAHHEADYAGFVEGLPAGGAVLDLGCGPGFWAARFRDDGYRVAAVDASPEMAEVALQTHGIEVSIAEFADIEVRGVFDGIWAFFSLLHAPRDDFPTHLFRLRNALKPGGRLCLAMKLGEGEGRDVLGRFYAYYHEDELRGILKVMGFTIETSRYGEGKGLAGVEEGFVVLTAHA